MSQPPTGGGGITFYGRPLSVRNIYFTWRDIALYLVDGFQWNDTIFMWVLFAEKVFKVRGQRSRSYVYKCVNAITAEAYISTMRLTCLTQSYRIIASVGLIASIVPGYTCSALYTSSTVISSLLRRHGIKQPITEVLMRKHRPRWKLKLNVSL